MSNVERSRRSNLAEVSHHRTALGLGKLLDGQVETTPESFGLDTIGSNLSIKNEKSGVQAVHREISYLGRGMLPHVKDERADNLMATKQKYWQDYINAAAQCAR